MFDQCPIKSFTFFILVHKIQTVIAQSELMGWKCSFKKRSKLIGTLCKQLVYFIFITLILCPGPFYARGNTFITLSLWSIKDLSWIVMIISRSDPCSVSWLKWQKMDLEVNFQPPFHTVLNRKLNTCAVCIYVLKIDQDLWKYHLICCQSYQRLSLLSCNLLVFVNGSLYTSYIRILCVLSLWKAKCILLILIMRYTNLL